MRSMRTLLLLAMVAAALMGPAANAESPEKEPYTRYRAMMEQYAKDMEEAAARYRSDIVGKVFDNEGNPYPEAKVLEELRGAQKKNSDAMASLDRARDAWTSRTDSLDSFFRYAAYAVQRSAQAAFAALADETRWRVVQLSARFAKQAWEQKAAFDKAAEAIRKADGYGKDADARVEVLRRDYEGRERTLILSTLQSYRGLTDALLARRRVLAGDLWRLVDFHERRGRPEDARTFRGFVYGIHCYALGATLGNSSDSDLDFFVRFPGSPDRLILRKYLVEDIETLHKMDSALRAEPVESLRQHDNTLPPLSFGGSTAEQIAQLLSARLVRFYTVQAAQDAIYARLKDLNAQAGVLTAPMPEVAPIEAAIDAFRSASAGESDAAARRSAADRAVSGAEDAQRAAERELNYARNEVRLNNRFEVVGPEAKNARLASQRLQEIRRQIALYQAQVDDPSLPEDQRKPLREVTIPRLQADVAKAEAAVTAACADKATSLQAATSRLDEARRARNALPAAGNPEGPARWSRVVELYAAARTALPEAYRKDLKDLPGRGDAAAASAATEAARALRARVAEFLAHREQVTHRLREAYGELGRCESELALLARSIAGVRISAAVEAERLLQVLGATGEDEVVKEIQRLKEGLGEGKDLLETADGRLEKLEKLRQKLTGDDRGGWIIETVQERLGTVSKTLEFIEGATEKGLAVKQAMEDLKDARTSLRAVSALLEAAGSAGGAIPVIGPTFGRFLGFYSQAAGACCDAACRIQDKLVRENVETLFSQPPPERHLYTQGEVDSGSSLQNEDARKRIAAMLQSRRLLFLAKASSLGEAQNMTR